ncbi:MULTISPECIES: hypothetical protein [Pacificibacter]|uniref:hypothetical protein n=1 Tax=Pacificibacter TaxID=1042323 RepID=UPI001C08325F|nr:MULTISPECIES: hypothetical protein [Pacificibacter]MBU2935007.1 hypothetical protein [Pacificibacter marinus]MDO6616361.1 hypothetical protein [Pacificibacter sp. 1_MG-2023]
MNFSMAQSQAKQDMTHKVTISGETLHKRIQDELMALVILAAEVQIALGPTLSEAKSLSPSVQRSLQAIDRLHQTLDDLQRIMGHLSNLDANSRIAVAPLSKAIRLRHLAHKLFDNVDSPFALTEEDSGDIAWF